MLQLGLIYLRLTLNQVILRQINRKTVFTNSRDATIDSAKNQADRKWVKSQKSKVKIFKL